MNKGEIKWTKEKPDKPGYWWIKFLTKKIRLVKIEERSGFLIIFDKEAWDVDMIHIFAECWSVDPVLESEITSEETLGMF